MLFPFLIILTTWCRSTSFTSQSILIFVLISLRLISYIFTHLRTSAEVPPMCFSQAFTQTTGFSPYNIPKPLTSTHLAIMWNALKPKPLIHNQAPQTFPWFPLAASHKNLIKWRAQSSKSVHCFFMIHFMHKVN